MTLTFRARVKSGRLVLDEPVDLPEGIEIDLVPADWSDDLDDADRSQLHEALGRADEQVRRGETLTKEEFLSRIRSAR